MFCIIKLKLSDTPLSTTNVRCRKLQLYSKGGGVHVFRDTFFPLGGGGCLKGADSGGRNRWFIQGGGFTIGGGSSIGAGGFPVKNFDVDNGWGGGGVDVVHNQGVLGEGGSWLGNGGL